MSVLGENDVLKEDVVVREIDEEKPSTEETNRVRPTIGRRELWLGVGLVLSGLLMANSIIYAGFNLGFAIAMIGSIVFSGGYFLIGRSRSQGKDRAYALALLGLSIVIAASFVRSDDGFVKFVMLCFLLVSVNLGLCLLAGKNRRNAQTAQTLGDVGYTFFSVGFGQMGNVSRGVKDAFRNGGAAGRRSGSVLLGLGLALPLVLIVGFLLMSADAAFEGLLDKMPDISVGELICTLIVGSMIISVWYTRAVGLRYCTPAPATARERKGLAALTVNTVLASVSGVYLMYLVSQLAYFTGGFAGILPEEYTLAQYARRGFFEMAVLCGINLSIIVFSLWIGEKKAPTPLSTRLFCLFIGIVTLFFVAAAGAKMILYIENYGLTRLRLLTQIIMIFLGLTAVIICLWLFIPRLPYMKVVILTALIMGAAVSWTDVDTQVAKYNVNAYLEDRIDGMDVGYLMNRLGDGAVPYLVKLKDRATDPQVLEDVKIALEHRKDRLTEIEEFRSWNYAKWKAAIYLWD